jgi:hypothetical protein
VFCLFFILFYFLFFCFAFAHPLVFVVVCSLPCVFTLCCYYLWWCVILHLLILLFDVVHHLALLLFVVVHHLVLLLPVVVCHFTLLLLVVVHHLALFFFVVVMLPCIVVVCWGSFLLPYAIIVHCGALPSPCVILSFHTIFRSSWPHLPLCCYSLLWFIILCFALLSFAYWGDVPPPPPPLLPCLGSRA